MKSINIKTPIPGPKSTALLKEKEEAVARGISTAYPIAIDKGEGAVLTDIDGNSYIDLASGIASLNVGHSPKPVVDALKNQLDSFINPVFNVTMHKPYIDLAKKLNQIVPGHFPKKSVFFNSGAEAIENAVKIARRYTGRKGIISFDRSFHGRTMLAMTLTGKVNSIKKGFGPLASDVHHAPYPYYFKDERTDEQLIGELKRLFQVTISPEEIAAIVLEPVQGDGGIIVPSKLFIQEIRAICDEFGIVFIADEIQTGFGRTGKMFAMEHFDCAADLTVMSKSIAAGIPLSAITGKEEIINFPAVKELGGTLSGNTLGCVAALEVIKMIENQNLLRRANEIGQFIKDKLSFDSKHIGEVRQIGAMIGIEIVLDKQSKASHRSFVNDVVHTCFEKGVLFMRAAEGDVIRLLPPLVITDEQLDEAISVIAYTIKELEVDTKLIMG